VGWILAKEEQSSIIVKHAPDRRRRGEIPTKTPRITAEEWEAKVRAEKQAEEARKKAAAEEWAEKEAKWAENAHRAEDAVAVSRTAYDKLPAVSREVLVQAVAWAKNNWAPVEDCPKIKKCLPLSETAEAALDYAEYVAAERGMFNPYD
jgi:hypothetical protein